MEYLDLFLREIAPIREDQFLSSYHPHGFFISRISEYAPRESGSNNLDSPPPRMKFHTSNVFTSDPPPIMSKLWSIHLVGKDDPNRINIGRTANNDIYLPVKVVSKLHSYLTHKGGEYHLFDADSLNFTLVNNNPLEAYKPYLLKDGDLISLGTHFHFHFYLPTTVFAKRIELLEKVNEYLARQKSRGEPS